MQSKGTNKGKAVREGLITLEQATAMLSENYLTGVSKSIKPRQDIFPYIKQNVRPA